MADKPDSDTAATRPRTRPVQPAMETYFQDKSDPDRGTWLGGQLKTSRLLAVLRAIGIMFWTLWLFVINLRQVIASKGLSPAVTQRWHRHVLNLTGMELSVYGKPVLDRPTLMVSNHASYLDIVVLGALLPCSFVSKAEVRHWPIFGFLAVLQRTVFIERDRRRAAEHSAQMRQRLSKGGCLVVFPEGTSTDGTRVLPFKSTLFQAASLELPETGQIEVQPISIAYSRLDGMPMGRAFRSFYTWYGDMGLAPHLMHWLGIGSLGIDVVFHPPVRMKDLGNRKALAAYAHQTISDGLERALKGNPSPGAFVPGAFVPGASVPGASVPGAGIVEPNTAVALETRP